MTDKHIRNIAENAFDEILGRIIDSGFNMEINWGLEFRALIDDLLDIDKKLINNHLKLKL